MRLSDLHLKYKGATPHTWLDTYESKTRRLDTLVSAFDEKEGQLRKAAIERGRAKVPKMICKCMDDDITCFNYNPYDIKALFHPVDFVVFNGLNNGGRLDDITFLSRKTLKGSLNKIRSSLELAIDKEKYNWHVARVSLDGKVKLE
jgi:predicted Holliday junction resolvase-like endonuclease